MLTDVNPNVELQFSWAQWTPNTTITLCNVPWDASYRDIVRFADEAARDGWFAGRDGIQCVQSVMHRFGEPVQLEVPFNAASNYNYLIAYNDYPQLESPRKWYYFVQKVEYINAHTTRFYIMLDVWQSFMYDVQFGSCYVTRGHIGIANEAQDADYGRTYLALPEGLDTGDEMVCTSQEYKSLVSIETVNRAEGVVTKMLNYGVIVVSTTDLTESPGTEDTPELKTAAGSEFENMTNGASVYYIADRWTFAEKILAAGNQYPWVTQGICAIYMVPPIPQDYLSQYGKAVDKLFGKTVKPSNVYQFTGAILSGMRYEDINVAANFRDRFNIPERYRNLKKLRCYPYSVVECTCLNGTTITYRPEDIQSNDFTLRETFNLAPNGTRLNFYPPEYNAAGAKTQTPIIESSDEYGLPIDGGEMLQAAFGISDLPQFIVVNNGAALALANSAYTRQYAQQTAGWTYSKALASANNAMYQSQLSQNYATQSTRLANANRNATNAITANSLSQSLAISQGSTNANASLAIRQNNANTALSMVSGGVGVIGNAASGNVGGAVSGIASMAGGMISNGITNSGISQSAAISNDTAAANTANSLATNAASTAQANAYANSSTALGNQYASDVANANYSLATYAAQGDYQNTIAGINAQVQQMQLTPPTSSGAIGGDGFNLANGIFGVLVRFKTCAPSALRSVGEYMLRYGYFVQRFIVPPASLTCMSRFTYWQMQECYVRGALPEEFRLTIKGMFERGVTVWASPDDIGVTDWADNEPVAGISY